WPVAGWAAGHSFEARAPGDAGARAIEDDAKATRSRARFDMRRMFTPGGEGRDFSPNPASGAGHSSLRRHDDHHTRARAIDPPRSDSDEPLARRLVVRRRAR